MKRIALILLSITFLTSCSWFEGPAGPQGPAGAANIIVKQFSINSNNTVIQDGIGINQVDVNEITEDVYNNGLVKLEVQISDAWYALPWTMSSDYSDDLSVDETVELTYGYAVGTIYVTHISSYSVLLQSQIEEGPYRLTIMPPPDTTSNKSKRKLKSQNSLFDHFKNLAEKK